MADETISSQPVPQQQPVNKTSPIQNAELGFGGIFLGIVFFLLFFSVLNYFNILPLSKLYPNQLGFLPHRPASQRGEPFTNFQSTVPSVSAPTVAPAKPILSCPVAKEFCNSGKITTYKGDPALTYNLASGSSILNATTIFGAKDAELFQNTIENTKTLYTATFFDKSCYVLTYMTGSDTIFEDLTTFPVQTGQHLARVTQTAISSGTEPASLILQIRKMEITPKTPCKIKGNEQKESGPFQPIETFQILK